MVLCFIRNEDEFAGCRWWRSTVCLSSFGIRVCCAENMLIPLHLFVAPAYPLFFGHFLFIGHLVRAGDDGEGGKHTPETSDGGGRNGFAPVAERYFGRRRLSRSDAEQSCQLPAVFQTLARFKGKAARDVAPRTGYPLFGARFDRVAAAVFDFQGVCRRLGHRVGAPEGKQAEYTCRNCGKDGGCRRFSALGFPCHGLLFFKRYSRRCPIVYILIENAPQYKLSAAGSPKGLI